jgi:hypothetical protein
MKRRYFPRCSSVHVRCASGPKMCRTAAKRTNTGDMEAAVPWGTCAWAKRNGRRFTASPPTRSSPPVKAPIPQRSGPRHAAQLPTTCPLVLRNCVKARHELHLTTWMRVGAAKLVRPPAGAEDSPNSTPLVLVPC